MSHLNVFEKDNFVKIYLSNTKTIVWQSINPEPNKIQKKRN